MEEIRFNSFEPKPTSNNESGASPTQQKKDSKISSLWMFIKKLVKVSIIVILVIVAIWGSLTIYKKYFSTNLGTYSAVFLSNGQVYFGKIEANNSKEIILNNVFYLQSGSSGQSGQSIEGSQFTLVKLGNELHGPTDQLFVNKQNVLFYEYLRDNSQVVQSIKNYKN